MAAGAAFGSTVQVTFVGVGPGVPTDGNNQFVTPYELTIDDGSGPPQLIFVTCYDQVDDVSIGDTWTANELSVTDAMTSGFFSSIDPDGYKEIAWLSSQTYADANHEIALQHAIWSIFGSAPTSQSETDPLQHQYYLDYLTALGNADLDSYDFSGITFLEQVDGHPGSTNPPTEQAFVFGIIVPNSTHSFGAPEPGTSVLIGGGLICLIASFGFKKLAAKRG